MIYSDKRLLFFLISQDTCAADLIELNIYCLIPAGSHCTIRNQGFGQYALSIREGPPITT